MVPPAVRRLQRLAGLGSRALAGAALAVDLTVGWSAGAGRAVLLAGLLASIPHGAVDHLVPRSLPGWRGPRPVLLALAYAAVAVAAFLVFRAAPGPALLVFLLLSVAHFGAGETAFADRAAARPRRRDPLTAAAFGAAVVLLPLAHHRADLAPLVAEVSGGNPGLPPGPAAAVEVTTLALLAVAAVRRWRRGAASEAADLALLTALVLVVPPTVAVGVYVGGWHAPRHLARMLSTEPANRTDLAAGRLGEPLWRFGRQAALPTLAVLLALVLFWPNARWPESAAVTVMVIAALTVPHALVVGALDRAARLASPAAGSSDRSRRSVPNDVGTPL
ncbi:Brp/Blh family beta-carotene 15,15'-dioxygenase [Micromonospora sp. WMMD1120]|uniref:Brp/Blh family beta-carotene 15,15'-dioxygenase n=1 Tax=Micromonospora sp. WMMD1120 TaxID=3016106 RepID=UPI002417AF4E|nr:Brp/Blh family beta-carotene 15,15'-dioxygenase [Micromonospora sp. WMMD1120]MDG4811123.1 Brp/Blh family beta-carotene 15,15'-dioxygenase [Micromonospora sp. WMMD1120]